jgi:peptidoglycan/LPS O-acetylase OafA/YrhL
MLPFLRSRSWPYASILSSNRLCQFIIGMFISYLYIYPQGREIWNAPFLGLTLVVSALCVYWIGFMEWPLFNFDNTPFLWRLGNITYHVSAALFVGAALSFEKQVSGRLPAFRLLRHLGDISYSTYLVHPIALCIAIYLLGQPQALFGELVALGSYTAMTLILSHLSYRWVATGPTMAFLKRSLLVPRA